ncbi:unnamed protein product, partial [marine sediment metagenome]
NINNVGIDNNTIPADILDEMINNNNQAYAVRTFNIVCVDCDLDKAGLDLPEDFRNTLTQKTGGGGKHYIFKQDDRMLYWTNLSGITEFKCDIKIGPNAYFVGAGSISQKGNYKIINSMKPTRMPDLLFHIINHSMGKETKPIDNHICCSRTELREIVDKIPIDKCVAYGDWIKLGMALYTETKGEIEGCKLWHEKSKLVQKYESIPFKKLKQHWKTFSSKGSVITIGTLKKWIKDAGIELEKKEEQKPQQALIELPDVNNTSISNLIYDR